MAKDRYPKPEGHIGNGEEPKGLYIGTGTLSSQLYSTHDRCNEVDLDEWMDVCE